MVSKICHVVMSLLVIFAFLAGCADVPSSGPTPPNPTTQMRFINADPALGSVTVSVDNSAAGTIAFQASTSYGEFPAGSRKISLNPGTAKDTARVSFTTDRRSTTFILAPGASGIREYFKVNDRFVYDASGVADKGLLRVINLVDVAAGVDVEAISAADTASTSSPLALKQGAGYWSLKPGSYTITYTESGGAVLSTSTLNLAANGRYTSVLLGTTAAPVTGNYTDN